MLNTVNFMGWEFCLHKEIFIYLLFLMYAILHNDNDKTTHIKESIHHIQDSELIQFLWGQARAVPSPPAGRKTTQPMGAFLPACRLTLLPAKADHQHVLSRALVTIQLQQLCSSQGWVSLLLSQSEGSIRDEGGDHETRVLEPEIESGLFPVADC